MFKIFLFVCLTIPATCFASCWLDVYTDEKTDVYIDYCSLVKVGKYKKAWTRWVFADNQTTTNSPVKEYDETKQLYYFDCALKTSAIVHITYYSPEPENQVVDSINVGFKSTKLRDVVPDTIGEAILKAACRK